jgi:uncharacterized protein YccT (UPF0319 family)
MADSICFPEEGDSVRGVKRLFNKVIYGATSVASSTGNKSVVTRTAAGVYTLTTTEKFYEFLGLRVTFNVNSTTPVDLVPQVYEVSQANKTVKFKLLTGTTATDPGTGTEAYIEVLYKDSSV